MESVIFYLLEAINTIAQTVLGVLLKGSNVPIWKSPYFWALVISAILGASLAIWQKIKFGRQQTKYKVLMDDQLEPLVRLLIKMSGSTMRVRRSELKNFIKTATVMAAGIAPSDKTRASVFEVVNPSPSKGNADPVPYMQPMKGSEAGRGDAPRSMFYKDRGEGKKVWENMLEEGSYFCPDTHSKKHLPEGWDATRERPYRSFISVGIESGDKFYGMLTINTPEPKKLHEDDINSMQVVAGLIASAMNLCNLRKNQFFVIGSK